MNADDLQELYKLLRGSRSALIVLDVRAMFLERQYSKGHQSLLEAREIYAESRFRLLKQDPAKDIDPKAKDADRQIKRLKRKQDKVNEILEAFDELLPQLEKLARRQQDKEKKEEALSQATSGVELDIANEMAAPEEKPASSVTAPDEHESEQADKETPMPADDYVVARSVALSDEFSKAFQTAIGDQKLAVIGRSFGFREVNSQQDIHSDALYFIHTGDKSYLIRTLPDAEVGDEVPLAGALDDKPMKPLSTKAFIKLGKKRKMVLLTEKLPVDERCEQDSDDDFESDFQVDSADQ